MNTVTIFFFAAISMAVAVDELKLLNDGNDMFTSNMFSEVQNEEAGKSMVMSGFSVLTPLAMLGLASVGESHDQILRAIGLPNDNVIIDLFPKLSTKLGAVKVVDLKMVNKLYLPKDAQVKENFAALTKSVFDSEYQNIDFAQSSAAAKEMNTWVEEQTNHTIKNLVDPDMIKTNTRVVLVNALYFKGDWLNRFASYNTKKRDFYVTKDKTVTVRTMSQEANFSYAESEELNAKLLELPYEGSEGSLLIILPNEIDGLKALVEKLKDPSVQDTATTQLQKQKVIVYLPKFRIESTINLKNVLPQMGVTNIFTRNANLINLLKNEKDVYVSDALQKAVIDVNEEGTSAAAANVISGAGSRGLRPEVQSSEFKADHPFVFVLKLGDQKLFTGVFAN